MFTPLIVTPCPSRYAVPLTTTMVGADAAVKVVLLSSIVPVTVMMPNDAPLAGKSRCVTPY